MRFVEPSYSRTQVDRAGRALSRGEERYMSRDEALEILGNWRAAHSYPLNTFQMRLRKVAPIMDPNSLVAQRLKRAPSIIGKMKRISGMKLSRVQDIGGCRAVLSTPELVYELRDDYLSSRIRHDLVRSDDYLATPKASGYRGLHLVYRYKSASEHRSPFDDLQVELQFRSKLQHAWATAVETVGLMLEQSLKASEGPDEWLEFFRLTASAFALKERLPIVSGTPSSFEALAPEIGVLQRRLNAFERLEGFAKALDVITTGEREGAYFLLALDPRAHQLRISAFSASEFADASRIYLEVEKEFADVHGADVVLVAVDSIENLRRAYPNYHLDTIVFIGEVRSMLRRGHR